MTPETCYTQTPNQRYEPAIRGNFPPYRLDRYAAAARPGACRSVRPNPLPATCISPDGADHWVPMVAADGTSYAGGYNGCAGLAPDQSAVDQLAQPAQHHLRQHRRPTAPDRPTSSSRTPTATRPWAARPPSACSIVVIPIMGISCDATAAALPPRRSAAGQGDWPTTSRPAPPAGQFAAAAAGSQSNDFPSDMAVSGQLWWSASNWRNRITIPITLAQTSAVCDIVGGGAPEAIYGSEAMQQLTQQWAPKFCLDSSLFPLQHVQLSEIQAKNLLATSVSNGQYAGIKAAFQAAPPAAPFKNPVVQAPTSVSGFGIAFVIDDAKQHQLTQLKLNARLLAKLLTMSYPAFTNIRDAWSRLSLYKPLANNPLDIVLRSRVPGPEPAGEVAGRNPEPDLGQQHAVRDVQRQRRDERAHLLHRGRPGGNGLAGRRAGPVGNAGKPLLQHQEPGRWQEQQADPADHLVAAAGPDLLRRPERLHQRRQGTGAAVDRGPAVRPVADPASTCSTASPTPRSTACSRPGRPTPLPGDWRPKDGSSPASGSCSAW